MKPTSSFLVSMRSNLLALFAGCVVAVCVTAQSFTPTDVAWMGQLGVAVEAPAGDGCGSDDLTFSWHCEDTDVANGSPAGCSIGDEVATLNSECVLTNTVKQDGSYSLFVPSMGDYASFDISASDLANGDQGTITFYWYCVSNIANSYILSVYGASTNNVNLRIQTLNRLQLEHYGNGTYRQLLTATNAFATNEWVKVECKWRRGTSPYMSITINDGVPAEYTASDLVEMNVAPTLLRLGSTTSTPSHCYLDNVKVWSVWK